MHLGGGAAPSRQPPSNFFIFKVASPQSHIAPKHAAKKKHKEKLKQQKEKQQKQRCPNAKTPNASGREALLPPNPPPAFLILLGCLLSQPHCPQAHHEKINTRRDFPTTTFRKEFGRKSSPGKVSLPTTTFMKEFGHKSNPGKVSLPTSTFMKEFLYWRPPLPVTTTTFFWGGGGRLLVLL